MRLWVDVLMMVVVVLNALTVASVTVLYKVATVVTAVLLQVVIMVFL